MTGFRFRYVGAAGDPAARGDGSCTALEASGARRNFVETPRSNDRTEREGFRDLQITQHDYVCPRRLLRLPCSIVNRRSPFRGISPTGCTFAVPSRA